MRKICFFFKVALVIAPYLQAMKHDFTLNLQMSVLSLQDLSAICVAKNKDEIQNKLFPFKIENILPREHYEQVNKFNGMVNILEFFKKRNFIPPCLVHSIKNIELFLFMASPGDRLELAKEIFIEYIKQNNVESVKHLLAYRVPDMDDTFLYYAIKYNCIPIAKELLKRRTPMSLMQYCGVSFMGLARRKNIQELISLVEEAEKKSLDYYLSRARND